MGKIPISIVFIFLLASCHDKHSNKGFYNKPIETINDSIKNRRAIDSQMALGNRPDSEQAGPSFQEVLAERLAAYNKVENIDKLVIDGKDSLQLHETYYCLHDSSLMVPKHYMWGGDTTKDFVTHNFAAKVVVIKNKDTVLNRTFKKNDFNKTLFEALKKYAIIFDASYIGYNKEKGEFALGYSISIPLTDVGVPAYLVVDKKGNYKVLDEYAKMSEYKKN
jgi:hypothetical protein